MVEWIAPSDIQNEREKYFSEKQIKVGYVLRPAIPSSAKHRVYYAMPGQDLFYSVLGH